MRDRIKVPFLGEVSDADARHTFFAEFVGESACALPGHRVGGGGEPGAVEAASERSVLDSDLICLDNV